MTARLEYLARETAHDAPEVSMVLLALSLEPEATVQERPIDTPSVLLQTTPSSLETEETEPKHAVLSGPSDSPVEHHS